MKVETQKSYENPTKKVVHIHILGEYYNVCDKLEIFVTNSSHQYLKTAIIILKFYERHGGIQNSSFDTKKLNSQKMLLIGQNVLLPFPTIILLHQNIYFP